MTEHMSLEEYRKLTGQVQVKSKYNAQKTEADGITFDSKAEAKRYQQLKLMQQAGEIQGFGRQPSFLFASGVRYRPDFIVKDNSGAVWVEDVKGVRTKEFELKRRLWESEYPWIELRVVK